MVYGHVLAIESVSFSLSLSLSFSHESLFFFPLSMIPPLLLCLSLGESTSISSISCSLSTESVVVDLSWMESAPFGVPIALPDDSVISSGDSSSKMISPRRDHSKMISPRLSLSAWTPRWISPWLSVSISSMMMKQTKSLSPGQSKWKRKVNLYPYLLFWLVVVLVCASWFVFVFVASYGWIKEDEKAILTVILVCNRGKSSRGFALLKWLNGW